VSVATTVRPLRDRTFRRYFLSFTINTAGTTMAPVALAFAVLHVSNSASALGIVLASNTVPMVVFLLFGGVIADRFPRVLLLRIGGLVAGIAQATAATLVITGVAHLWMLAVLEAIGGLAQAVIFPAFSALMPQLLPREHLQEGNVLLSMARGATRVLGPTLSALLVVGVGPGWALGVDALTWFVAIALLRIRVPQRKREETGGSALSELREGWSLVTGTPWLWIVVLAFAVLNAIHTGAWFTLGPLRAKETFGAQGWGLLLSAESVGLLLTTLVMTRWRPRHPLRSGMIGVSLLALPIFVLGASAHLPALLVLTFVAGAGIEVMNLGWQLAMQENIDESMLSRAYSYDALGSFVAMPAGQLLYGPLGAAFGLRKVLMISGVVYGVLALSCLASRSVRDLPRAVSTTSAPAS